MAAIAYLPVLAAGVASVIIGSVWFSPWMFAGAWTRLANISPEMAERGKRRMWLSMVVALLASMLAAWVMSYVIAAWGAFEWIGALEIGFWCWLGFTAPPMLGMVLWEMKPVRYYLIVAGQWLVSFLVMALILVYGSQALLASTYTPATGAGTAYSE